MGYQDLKKALLDRLGCSPQALSQRVTRKKSSVPMFTEEAVCLIAFENKLDISKYVDRDMVEAVRRLQQQHLPIEQTPPSSTARGRKTTRVNIVGDLELKDPLLSTPVLNEAKSMAQVYPYLYLLENSVRTLIVSVLGTAHGPDWWDTAVPEEIKRIVSDRMKKENKNRWHGKRGAHPIFYMDFGHLRRIVITKRNWPYFEPLLPSQEWLTQRLDEVEISRNVIAHCNPLHKDDVERVKFYLRDWQRQMHNANVPPSDS